MPREVLEGNDERGGCYVVGRRKAESEVEGIVRELFLGDDCAFNLAVAALPQPKHCSAVRHNAPLSAGPTIPEEPQAPRKQHDTNGLCFSISRFFWLLPCLAAPPKFQRGTCQVQAGTQMRTGGWRRNSASWPTP
eukprot:2667775-Rhodomonas_salina.3